LFFSHLFPEAEILAIEPASDNISVARMNVASFPNIRLLEAAVHSEDCDITLDTSEVETRGEWAYTTRPKSKADRDSVVVKGVSLNSLCAEGAGERLLLVKIDIEGAESELFSGPLLWMNSTPLIIIELHDWALPGKGTSASFFRALEGRRFEILQQGENLFLFFAMPPV